MKTVLTSNGYILSPAQVAEHLKARFNTDEWMQTQLKKTINEVGPLQTPHPWDSHSRDPQRDPWHQRTKCLHRRIPISGRW